jgi:hypothetical protein
MEYVCLLLVAIVVLQVGITNNCVQFFNMKLNIGKYDVKYHTTTPRHGCNCWRRGVMNIPSLDVVLELSK